MRSEDGFEAVDLTTCDVVRGGRDLGLGWRQTVFDDGSELHEHENGARVATTTDDTAIFNWYAPRVTSDMDAPTVREHARWWNEFRDDNGLNKVGPDGQEHLDIYQRLGRNESLQQFAGYHDIYASEAYRQALVEGTPEAMADYNAANEDSARWGGARAMELGPIAGEGFARDIFYSYGFDIEREPAPWETPPVEPPRESPQEPPPELPPEP